MNEITVKNVLQWIKEIKTAELSADDGVCIYLYDSEGKGGVIPSFRIILEPGESEAERFAVISDENDETVLELSVGEEGYQEIEDIIYSMCNDIE